MMNYPSRCRVGRSVGGLRLTDRTDFAADRLTHLPDLQEDRRRKVGEPVGDLAAEQPSRNRADRTTHPTAFQDKHWIYYAGSKERHDIYRTREGKSRWQCSIGLATLRLDGFICLEAKDEPGIVVTKPFKLTGGQLELNVDAGNGHVRVEVLDQAGEPIPGFAQTDAKMFREVDDLRLRPLWKGGKDLRELKGKVVRLRFHLKNARLYAFQVVP